MSYESAKKRLEAATTGEWSWLGNDIETDDWTQAMPMETTVECSSYCYGGSAKVCISDANREFIAHAKQDIQALLKIVRCVRELAYTNDEDCQEAKEQRFQDLMKAYNEFEEMP